MPRGKGALITSVQAPEPSGGDLSETVTGDYASYKTYANLGTVSFFRD